MSSRWRWGAATLAGYGAALSILYGVPLRSGADDAPWRIAHTLLYAGWGMLLLALVARAFPRTSVHGWRAASFAVGALAAGTGLRLTQDPWRTSSSFEAWMAALLGLALAMMLPRWLPTVMTRRWLDIERRHDPR